MSNRDEPLDDAARRLCEQLGYSFADKGLLLDALTHRSFKNERPDIAAADNERLEFLGDAVVGLVVAGLCRRDLPRRRGGCSVRCGSPNFRAAVAHQRAGAPGREVACTGMGSGTPCRDTELPIGRNPRPRPRSRVHRSVRASRGRDRDRRGPIEARRRAVRSQRRPRQMGAGGVSGVG